jgi:hypothetical protein
MNCIAEGIPMRPASPVTSPRKRGEVALAAYEWESH